MNEMRLISYRIQADNTRAYIVHNGKGVGVFSTRGIERYFSEYKSFLDKVAEAYTKSIDAIEAGNIKKYKSEKIQGFSLHMLGATQAKLMFNDREFAQIELKAIYSSADEVERFTYRVARLYRKYMEKIHLG